MTDPDWPQRLAEEKIDLPTNLHERILKEIARRRFWKRTWDFGLSVACSIVLATIAVFIDIRANNGPWVFDEAVSNFAMNGPQILQIWSDLVPNLTSHTGLIFTLVFAVCFGLMNMGWLRSRWLRFVQVPKLPNR